VGKFPILEIEAGNDNGINIEMQMASLKFDYPLKTATRFYFFLLVFVASGLFTFVSCQKSNSGGNSHLEVRLTDDPSGYDAVYIDVQKVEVNVSSDTAATNGWQTINVLHPGVYNLLSFKNGN